MCIRDRFFAVFPKIEENRELYEVFHTQMNDYSASTAYRIVLFEEMYVYLVCSDESMGEMCIRDRLMCDTMLRQMCLEQGGPVPMGSEAVCELGAIICLDAFDGHREGFDQMFQEQSGRIGAMLLKSLYKAPAGVFIDGGVLEELLSNKGTVLELSLIHIYADGNSIHSQSV